jgi:acylphosphatase
VRARRAIVTGRVQGVGYRFFAERAARELGVRGWVRNLPDGSVEAVAEGEDEAIARFLERLRRGPLGSRVEALAEEDRALTGFSSFEITR